MTTQARRKQEKLTRMLDLLIEAHGRRDWVRRGPCINVLVGMFLLQNANPINARSAYRQLRRTFRSWDQVAEAPIRDVQRHLAICGLGRMRAHRLHAILQRIKQERDGRIELEFLADLSPQAAYGYLISFRGIGPCTANATLLVGLNMPRFPVDKRIQRIARRTRLVPANASELKTQRILDAILAPEQCYPLHVLLSELSQTTCRPRNPKCDQCPLLPLCPHGQRKLKHRPPADPPAGIRQQLPRILSRRASGGMPVFSLADHNGDSPSSE